MADIEKRLKYYTGQFLQQKDFADEQEYHLDRLRRHNRQLHTPGIAHGLAVTANNGEISAVVAPGTALDAAGQLIVLKDPYNVAFENPLHGKTVLVVISYAEQPSDEATVGDIDKTRYWELPQVRVFDESVAPSADLAIRLARLRIDSDGLIAEHDPSVRIPAGARVRPHETFESLRLSRPGSSGSSQQPVLTSGAASRLDLAGDLDVTGNILVTGTVDGRDVSVDGAANDAHRLDRNNPHVVTAFQVGAIASIQGISNPGGNIAVNGASGITVTGNAAANTITVAGGSPTSIQGVSNPGGNIAIAGAGGIAVAGDDPGNTITITGSAPSSIQGVSNPGGNIVINGIDGVTVTGDDPGNTITIKGSAPSSIHGVSNPGGNIAINGAGGIAVTADDPGNKITITGSSPASIAGVSNPGGNIPINGSGGISVGTAGGAINISTSAGAIGALPAGDYLKRSLASVAFGASDGDWTSRTISLGFAPKQIWVTGRAFARLTDPPYPNPLSEGYYGGVTGGFCLVNGPGSYSQHGFAPHVRRFPMTTSVFANTFTWNMFQDSVSGVGGLYCADRYSNPQQRIYLRVYVSSVGATSFVLTLRRDHEGYAQPYYFYMELYITTLG